MSPLFEKTFWNEKYFLQIFELLKSKKKCEDVIYMHEKIWKEQKYSLVFKSGNNTKS